MALLAFPSVRFRAVAPLLIIATSLWGEASPGDHFGFALKSEQPIQGEPRPGEFRVAAGERLWIGGGLEAKGKWGQWGGFSPSADAAVYDMTPNALSMRKHELPAAVAWAAVIPHEGDLIVVGGLRSDGFSAAVERWTPIDAGWKTTALPPLPRPIAFAGATVMDGTLFVAGGWAPGSGAHPNLLSLSLDRTASTWHSELLPVDTPWLNPQLVVRKDEKVLRNALFISGGWTSDFTDSGKWMPMSENWKYHQPDSPRSGWTKLGTITPEAWLPLSAPLGPSHIIGLAVTEFRDLPYPALTNPDQWSASGFLRYHVFTDTWAEFATHGEAAASFFASIDKDRVLLATSAGDAERLHSASITSVKRRFAFWDYGVMAVYLGGLVWIGAYFSRKEKGTEDFFLGGRKIPWWAAGLSIYATGTSAISFMAIPAKTYATDWLYFIGMSVFPFFTVTIAAFVFIPLLRSLNLTTVMEYFEMRFGRSIRLLMSSITVLGQVAGRMSITLLLPSIALTAVTGMDIYTCILMMGILATIYTVLGGINAVIWTDVVQVFVLFGGAILSIILVLAKVDGGIVTLGALAVEDDKFHLTDWSWDFTTATMWVMFIWAISDVFGKGLGQEGLQRAFSTKDVRDARRSMITCAVVALPAGFLFYGIGTALYAFYHQYPQLLDPTLQTDAIFPLFIAQQLPVGIAGLVISALFAASMSTLDTAMNTSATIVTRDFYSIWRKGSHDREQLILAKSVTVFCGLFGTGIALYMASFGNIGSLWDMFSILIGVIGGGLGGVGFLALCTTRANTAGTLTGALVTAISMILIQRHTPVHFFTYGTVSLVIGSTSGYLFSLIYGLFPRWRQAKDLTGLTLWTRTKSVAK